MILQLFFLTLCESAWGHGYIFWPKPRQGHVPTTPGGCGYCSCCWYTNKISIPGDPTICDKDLLTMNIPNPCSGSDWTRKQPWRAPGTAPIISSCGAYQGQDAAKLPPTNRTKWQRGALAEVSQAITANHGGGYAYRICPAANEPTEACFQAHHLAFAEGTHTVVMANGKTIDIPAKRTTVGTFPAGSQWSKNPIPDQVGPDFPEPFPGGSGHDWNFSLMDRLRVPSDLPLGDYVLSWRWDCEQTPQVWSNCADISIVDSSSPAPKPPAPTPTPPSPVPPTSGHCCWGGSSCTSATKCYTDGFCSSSADHCTVNCTARWCPSELLV